MNKLIVGGLLFLIASACVVGFSVTQSASATRITINGVALTVELAKTAAAQQRGLSGRSSLPYDHGMLFVFDHEDYWGFWMTEMKFPLDIIWFDSNRQAVFMEQNLPPCTPESCPVFTPNTKAMYVLEVNAGFVSAHKIPLGTIFTFLGT